MKAIHGYWFPDSDQHFEAHLRRSGGEYQKDRRDLALRHVRNFGLAVDVGGHVGLWSRDLSRRFDRVVAFEPIAELRACFERNVDMTGVTLHACALGARPGSVRIGNPSPDNSGGFTHEAEQGEEVPVRTLDSFALDGCDFIKLDIQGMEREALEGARETIARFGPTLCVEQRKGETAALDFARRELGYRTRARRGKEHILRPRRRLWAFLGGGRRPAPSPAGS